MYLIYLNKRRHHRRRFCIKGYISFLIGCFLFSQIVVGQEGEKSNRTKQSFARGSIVEDRAARRLMDAGDLRVEAGETDKGLELWLSLIHI